MFVYVDVNCLSALHVKATFVLREKFAWDNIGIFRFDLTVVLFVLFMARFNMGKPSNTCALGLASKNLPASLLITEWNPDA